MFESSQWSDCLLNLLANTDLETVLRGCVVVRNMMSSSAREVAERVVETQIMDCMQAHIFKAQRELYLLKFRTKNFSRKSSLKMSCIFFRGWSLF